MTNTLYDTIGFGYSRRRKPDPRIARQIHAALGEKQVIANVGAGTGSYEPQDRSVISIEPSARMIRQRAAGSNLVIQGVAERLPLRNNSVDGAMAVLTVHHWTDWKQGVREIQRVTSGPIVILTWDPAHTGFWLTDRYFPEIIAKDRKIFPSIEDVTNELGFATSLEVAVPHDCLDGFLGAYWRRPESYLDPQTRSAISAFANLSRLDEGLRRLEAELKDGTWSSLYGELLSRSELDVGYRIIASERRPDGGRHVRPTTVEI
jgi:SAM-dependent methyltransferase